MATSGPSHLVWLIIALACQFLWGTYPAVIRYMQTKAEHPLTSLQLSFMINLLACPALFFGTTLPLWIARKWRRSRRAKKTAALVQNGLVAKPPAGLLGNSKLENGSVPNGFEANGSASISSVPNGSPFASYPAWDSALAEPLLNPVDEEEANGEAHVDVEEAVSGSTALPALNGLLPEVSPVAEEPPQDAQHEPERPHKNWKAQGKVLLMTTFFLSSLFLAQVFSLLFTTVRPMLRCTAQAYLSQMVFLLAPVIVALAAKGLFKSPLPKGLWPALALMLLGCSMVIVSKAMAAGSHPKNALAAPGGPVAPTLWAGRAEEAWLCNGIFGEERGSWLCGLDLEEEEEQEADEAEEDWVQDADGGWVQDEAEATARGGSGAEDSMDGVDSLDKAHGKGMEEDPGKGKAHCKGKPHKGKAESLKGKGKGKGKEPVKVKKPKPKPPKLPKPHPHDSGGLGMHDMLGIGLSFWGACCVAGFMTVVQRTHGTCSDQQVLWANFLTQIPMCFTLTYVFEGDHIGMLLHLGLAEVAEVFALAAGVNWFANWVQQLCIRNLGAPQAAAFLPMRLLGSLVASYPLLHEGLVGPLQWGGVLILLVAVSWYLLQQKRSAEEGSASTELLLHHEFSGPVYVA